MEEHKVDIVKFGLGQALIDLVFGPFIADIKDLGREENLIPREG
jgi:hypothetical protein